jgi:hypothetical protein
MGKLYDAIDPDLAAWIGRQPLFFVATAPASLTGHVNCSPKGLDTLRVLGPTSVAYLDLTGSGAETIAHVRENGRIVFMFCAFSGPPKIVRLHGNAEVIEPSSPRWEDLLKLFPAHPGARTIIRANVSRISDSCGYGVPKLDLVEDRDALPRWTETKGPSGLPTYRRQKNGTSIDGLPALDPGDA